jgi:nucleoside-diphosphate-sugar epimerase
MRVLVTGANGFIGKYACALLAQKAFTVVPIVREKRETKQLVLAYPDVILGDLRELDWLREAVEAGPDLVVHLAAVMPASFKKDEGLSAAETNALIDRNVFSFCQKIRIGLVYASGTSVYGLGDGRVVKESDKTSPVGPYVAQKVRSEEMGASFFEQRGLQFAALRICAPYGPGQKTATVLKIFVDRALQGLPLFYHGTGSRQQDFTYVEDIAAAIVLTAETRKSGVYNIAGGSPVSMKQLAEMVVHHVPNCSSNVRPSGQKDPQEKSTALFSIEKARKELGWTPQVDLEEGLNICIKAELSKRG